MIVAKAPKREAEIRCRRQINIYAIHHTLSDLHTHTLAPYCTKCGVFVFLNCDALNERRQLAHIN